MRYVGDRVAAVAAVDEETVDRALELIEVEYQELEPVLDPREAMRDGAPIIHDEEECKVIIPIPYEPKKNMCATVSAIVGDVDKAIAESDFSFELTKNKSIYKVRSPSFFNSAKIFLISEVLPCRRGQKIIIFCPFFSSDFNSFVSFSLSVKYKPDTASPYIKGFSMSIAPL